MNPSHPKGCDVFHPRPSLPACRTCRKRGKSGSPLAGVTYVCVDGLAESRIAYGSGRYADPVAQLGGGIYRLQRE